MSKSSGSTRASSSSAPKGLSGGGSTPKGASSSFNSARVLPGGVIGKEVNFSQMDVSNRFNQRDKTNPEGWIRTQMEKSGSAWNKIWLTPSQRSSIAQDISNIDTEVKNMLNTRNSGETRQDSRVRAATMISDMRDSLVKYGHTTKEADAAIKELGYKFKKR